MEYLQENYPTAFGMVSGTRIPNPRDWGRRWSVKTADIFAVTSARILFFVPHVRYFRSSKKSLGQEISLFFSQAFFFYPRLLFCRPLSLFSIRTLGRILFFFYIFPTIISLPFVPEVNPNNIGACRIVIFHFIRRFQY